MPRTLKSQKTPLRYPGGKSRALANLFRFLPDLTQAKEYREPFLGGGSVAIEVTKRYPNLPIWVNDLYKPLCLFWTALRDDGNYLINKCSFSGLTESSSFSKQASESNFSIRGIENLKTYSTLIKNWKITNDSYVNLLSDDEDIITYLDPPYEIKSNLYGKKGNMHKGFDHDGFATLCDQFDGHQLISYNSSQLIRDRFKEWTVAEFAHTCLLYTSPSPRDRG